MSFAKIWFIIVFILFLGFIYVAFQTFKPVRNVTPEDVIEIEGQVEKVSLAPDQDIVIALKNDENYYYINRATQLGLQVDTLKSKILGKTVKLYPIKRWTIFTRDGILGHISKLECQGKVLFNEIITGDGKK